MPKPLPPHPQSRLSTKKLLGALIALIVFFMLLTSVIGLAEKYFAIKDRTGELKAQQAKLEEKEIALTEQNAYLETLDGQQQSLRAKFNVVRPGEGMIIVTAPIEPAPVETSETSRMKHWWNTLVRGLGFGKE